MTSMFFFIIVVSLVIIFAYFLMSIPSVSLIENILLFIKTYVNKIKDLFSIPHSFQSLPQQSIFLGNIKVYSALTFLPLTIY
jgi:hypothetical protein